MRKIEFDKMQELRSMITAVALAASTDDMRPDMNGVGLEVFDGELRIMATNGAWAMRVRRKPRYADDGFKVIIPLSYVKRLVALIGDGIGQILILHDQDLVRFEVEKIGRLDVPTGGVAAVPLVNIEKAWPTSPARPMNDAVGFNESLLTRIGKAFGQLAEKPTLRFAFHGDDHPIVVTCEEKDYAEALLMPCNLEDDDGEEEDKQRKLFPETEEESGATEVVRAALRNLRNSVPVAEVTLSSGGRSVRLKGKTKPMLRAPVKKVAAKRKKNAR